MSMAKISIYADGAGDDYMTVSRVFVSRCSKNKITKYGWDGARVRVLFRHCVYCTVLAFLKNLRQTENV